MIYEPVASRRYEKLPVSKSANDVGFSFFSANPLLPPPIFIACHYVIFPHFYIVICHIDVSLYFDEMNTFETINMNYGGNQDTRGIKGAHFIK